MMYTSKNLYECAKCKSSDVNLLSKIRVDATEEEKNEEIRTAKVLADASGINVEEIIIPSVDFYRYNWSFECNDCGCKTQVRTEIDRY